MDKRNLMITNMCMIFVLLIPGVTAIYMRHGVTVPLLVALIINLIAIPIVVLCLIMEIRKQKRG